jgi:hypothetical protein
MAEPASKKRTYRTPDFRAYGGVSQLTGAQVQPLLNSDGVGLMKTA